MYINIFTLTLITVNAILNMQEVRYESEIIF